MLNAREISTRIQQENHSTIDHLELTLHRNETYIQWQPQQIDLSSVDQEQESSRFSIKKIHYLNDRNKKFHAS